MNDTIRVTNTKLRPKSRSEAQPWHTNAALIVLGFGLICLTKQLISEGDHFTIGFSGTSSCSLFFYLGAVVVFLMKPRNTDRYTLPIILTVAIACRIVGLFPDPFLSSDVYRYAWDGAVQHAHISPYRYVPGDPALAFLREPNADLFANMNRRDYAHTIYPPVAQMLFWIITFLSPTVIFMKVAMVLCEGVTVYGLLLLLRQIGLPREWVLLYAWSPLCIWEFGSSGHVDAPVIAFLVLAFLFRLRRQPWLTGLFLGLAVFTKFYPIVLFPALYQLQIGGESKSGNELEWKMPAALIAVAIVSYSMYLSAGKLVFGFLGGYVEEEGIATGTRYFPLEFAQRLPGLHSLSNAVFLAFVVVIFGGLTVWAWRTCCQPDSMPACFLKVAMSFSLALMLLFSPHYPWYVAWLIPFLVLAPSLTILTYVCGLFYLCTTALATGSGEPQYHLNVFLYSAVLIAAIVEAALLRVPFVADWLKVNAPYGFGYPTSRVSD